MKKDWMMNLFGSKEGKVTQKETESGKEFFTVDNLKEHLRLLVAIDQPIGMYITDKEGVILAHNDHYCKLLGLDTIVDGKTNCSDFYQNPNDRTDRNETIDHDPENDKWFVDVILLKNHKDEVIVKDSTHKVFDDNGEHIAYFGYLVDVSDEYRFGRLFENLLIGSYQLDKEDKFVKINKAAETMLGYTSDELNGKHVDTVYAEKEKYHELKDRVLQDPHYVKNEEVQLVKKDGKLIWTSVDAYKIPLTGKEYFGRHGTIIDVTDKVFQRKLADFPVGYYVVISKGDTHKVEHCNDKFAKIFGYKDVYKVEGMNPNAFFQNDIEYIKYLTELFKAKNEKQSLIAYKFKGKKADGSTFDAEISSQLNLDINNNIIGRVGVVRDISKETAVENKMTKISTDIGAVLHTYSTLLILINNKLEAIQMSFGNDPFISKGELTGLVINSELRRVFEPFISRMEDMLHDPVKQGCMQESLNLNQQSILEFYVLIGQYYKVDNPRQNVPILRELMYNINSHLRVLSSKDECKDRDTQNQLQAVKRNSEEIMRTLALIALHEITDNVKTIEPNLISFRKYVTDDIRAEGAITPINIYELLTDLISDFKDFAHHYHTYFKVEILDSSEIREMMVTASKDDLKRALHNILHNAIKYTWNQEKGLQNVDVSLKRREDKAAITVNNYGVAIRKEEIENRLIFNLGYRGLQSGDRKRMGTGFGLSDSYNVIVKKLGGDLQISSVPTNRDTAPDDYSKMFVTTVTIILPLWKAKEESTKHKK